jgi:hypothetical protein
MSQVIRRNTTNLVNFTPRRLTTLTLTASEADALIEMATLVRYTGGFTYTREMERACQTIADCYGTAARRAVLARANQRERIEILA